MFNPGDAEDFCHIMEEIWQDVSEPTASGGLILYHKLGPDVYDKWHDARKVARACKATEGPAHSHHNEQGNIWTFPSGFRVWISNYHGASCHPAEKTNAS